VCPLGREIPDDATQVVVGDSPIRQIRAVRMLDGADVTGRELAAIGGADGRDGRLFEAEPAPFDEHDAKTTLRAAFATLLERRISRNCRGVLYSHCLDNPGGISGRIGQPH
jgi:hypothetical protein